MTAIVQGSPADQAGLHVGDRVLAVNGQAPATDGAALSTGDDVCQHAGTPATHSRRSLSMWAAMQAPMLILLLLAFNMANTVSLCPSSWH